MQINKPYVWVDDASANSTLLRIAIQPDANKSWNWDKSIDDSSNLRLIIKLKLTAGSGTVLEKSDTLENLFAGFNPSVHKRVIVMLFEGSVLKGSTTVRPHNTPDHFTTDIVSDSTTLFQNDAPYCWLKFITASESELYFICSLANGKTLSGPAYVKDPNNKTFRIKYLITSGSGPTIEERNVRLNSSIEYDPTYEYIEVQLLENNPTTEKGKGTTTQTEADSSGDS